MRRYRITTVAAAVVLAGGFIVWTGCGAGGSRPEAEAPTRDEKSVDRDAAPRYTEIAAIDESTSAEPVEARPGATAETPWAEPKMEWPDVSAPDLIEGPGGAAPSMALPSQDDLVGPSAPMTSPLLAPAATPEPTVTVDPNPVRQDDTSPNMALSPANPMRAPLRSMMAAPQPAMAPAAASPMETAEPMYRMTEPDSQPAEAADLIAERAAARESSTARSLTASKTDPFSDAGDEPTDAMFPMTAPMAAVPEAASEPEPIVSEPAQPAPEESLAADNRSEATDSDQAEEDPDYKLVTVFYGTDRKAVSADDAVGPIYSNSWFITAAVAAGITLLLLGIAVWIAPGRTATVLACLGVMATLALAAVTTLDYLQAKASVGNLARSYGNERGELEVGTCQVSIPKHHEVGQVERPSLLRGEVYEDPRRHVVLLTIDLEDEDLFYSGLKSHVNRSERKEAFVFVHGFNVTFDEAARRTAQLAYDLGFDGPPIFFSWPSQGGLLKYAVDETNVVWAVPHLKQFLLDVARRSDAESVHLIAHSMGNRALTSALQSIAYEMQNEPPIFREVLLTAPDIDADVFKRDIAPAIVQTADRITLYASSNDEALTLSKQVHGYPRAGDSGPGLVVVEGIDTIDVSTVDTSLLGHSYYGSNHTVIADMLDLLHDAKPPDQRPFLRPRQLGEMFYWIFNPERLSGLMPKPEPAVR